MIYDNEIKEKAVSLFKEGMTPNEVAREIGCSNTSVINWVKEARIFNLYEKNDKKILREDDELVQKNKQTDKNINIVINVYS